MRNSNVYQKHKYRNTPARNPLLFYTLGYFSYLTVHKYIKTTKIPSNKFIMLKVSYEKTKNALCLKTNKFSCE
jgi:hypothetical protein